MTKFGGSGLSHTWHYYSVKVSTQAGSTLGGQYYQSTQERQHWLDDSAAANDCRDANLWTGATFAREFC